MNTSLKDTKVAQHFTVPMFRLIWQILLGIIGVVSLYFAIIHNVDRNETNIGVNKVYGQETRKIVVGHIDDTKGQPLTELELQGKVENLEDDVKDHNVKLNAHNEQILINKTMGSVIREDQKIMKADIKEILTLVKKGD